MPFFSVVIPTYNRAGFIEQTINSVLRQTFSDFEVIVVDDGSKDNTREVVAAIRDSRVFYHYKENEERAAARNMGVRLARGKYVTFLDSDDLLYENHLATAMKVVEQYGEPEFFHLGYEIKDVSQAKTRRVDYLPEIANEALISGNHLSCGGVFLRRDIAERNPFNTDRDLSGTEDYELWLRLASQYDLICNNEVTSAVLQHGDRSVLKTDREKLIKRIELLEKYLFDHDEFMHRFGKNIGAFKANNRVYIALHLALTKRHRLGAVTYLVKALLCSPKALKNRAFYGTIKRLFV